MTGHPESVTSSKICKIKVLVCVKFEHQLNSLDFHIKPMGEYKHDPQYLIVQTPKKKKKQVFCESQTTLYFLFILLYILCPNINV